MNSHGGKDDDSDRRRGERVDVNHEFRAMETTATYVSDLSEHGVFVHTVECPAVGATVELRFTVLLDEPVVIQGLGKIIRIQENPAGVGVEFGPLSPEMVLRIQDAVSRQRPRSSGRPTHGVSEVFASRPIAAPEAVDEEEVTGVYASGPMGEGTPRVPVGDVEVTEVFEARTPESEETQVFDSGAPEPAAESAPVGGAETDLVRDPRKG